MDSPIYVAINIAHIVGAIGIGAAYAIETVGLAGLRLAYNADQARTWLVTRRWVLLAGPPSIGLVLLSGLYMAIAGWGFVPWIVMAVIAVVGLAVIGGGLTGIPMAAVTRALERPESSLAEAAGAIRNPLLVISITTRVAITAAIVYLMVVKPDLWPSLLSVVAAVLVGLLFGWGLATRLSSRSATGEVGA